MSDPEPPRLITELQAYDALILYLKRAAEKTHSEDLHTLYEWAAYKELDDHGSPMPMIIGEYERWLNCVDEAVEHPEPFPRRHPTAG